MSSSPSPRNSKTDFRKTWLGYQGRVGEFERLWLPPTRYLMIDGHGDPNTSPDFRTALGALYPAGYTLKFASRNQLGLDYVAPPLEGLWWAEDMSAFTTARDKSQWSWTLLLMVPDWVPESLASGALESVARRRLAPDRIEDVRVGTLDEGLCVQTLHVGPFDHEAAVLHRMHTEIIPSLGLQLTGTHHEIYLSDSRRVPPERRRTLLRQPVSEVRRPVLTTGG